LSHSRGRRTRGGTVVDAARVVELAHAAGALAWVDAVHYAAHEPVDFKALGADVLLCSAYKCADPTSASDRRRARRRRLAAIQGAPERKRPLRPRFNTGTQAYELLAESLRRSSTWRASGHVWAARLRA
jgi:kynureninase